MKESGHKVSLLTKEEFAIDFAGRGKIGFLLWQEPECVKFSPREATHAQK